MSDDKTFSNKPDKDPPPTIAWGESAAAIMAAALLQESVGMEPAAFPRPKHFLEVSKPVIGHHTVWKRLDERVEALTKAYSQDKDAS